jgi:hypothetical protein
MNQRHSDIRRQARAAAGRFAVQINHSRVHLALCARRGDQSVGATIG